MAFMPNPRTLAQSSRVSGMALSVAVGPAMLSACSHVVRVSVCATACHASITTLSWPPVHLFVSNVLPSCPNSSQGGHQVASPGE